MAPPSGHPPRYLPRADFVCGSRTRREWSSAMNCDAGLATVAISCSSSKFNHQYDISLSSSSGDGEGLHRCANYLLPEFTSGYMIASFSKIRVVSATCVKPKECGIILEHMACRICLQQQEISTSRRTLREGSTNLNAAHSHYFKGSPSKPDVLSLGS